MKLIISSELIEYNHAIEQMQKWVDTKQPTLWFLEHEDVFTVGRAGYQGCLNKSGIPVLQTDRGGSVVYHGPGQRIVYFVCPMNYVAENISKAVELIEDWMVKSASILQPKFSFLKRIHGPGVWMQGCSSLLQKIGFIGLRVSKVNGEDWLSHGVAINYNAKIDPFETISICNNDENVAGNLKVSAAMLDDVLLENLPINKDILIEK